MNETTDQPQPNPPAQPGSGYTEFTETVKLSPEDEAARKRRNGVIALGLISFCVLIALITGLRLSAASKQTALETESVGKTEVLRADEEAADIAAREAAAAGSDEAAASDEDDTTATDEEDAPAMNEGEAT